MIKEAIDIYLSVNGDYVSLRPQYGEYSNEPVYTRISNGSGLFRIRTGMVNFFSDGVDYLYLREGASNVVGSDWVCQAVRSALLGSDWVCQMV